MPLVSDAVIILQTFSYSETSRILRLLTRQHGVQSVIAKGALRPRSRFGGVLEPFTEGTATFYLREGRDLHTLSGFELTRSHQPIGLHLLRFGGASLLAELVLRVGSAETDPALFDALYHAIDTIEHVPVAQLESTVLACAWTVVAMLGFAPALDDCQACERVLDTTEDVIFDYTTGGVRCLPCGADHGGRQVPAAARLALRQLVRGEAVTLERTAAHWRLLSRFLSHHVLEGQTLHSLAFLASATGDAT